MYHFDPDRYEPCNSASRDLSSKGLAPKHAERYPLYSEIWYRVCNDAFIDAMWAKMKMLPKDPRERQATKKMTAAGEWIE